ncbi:MAG: phosphate ABC transporter substrate-binding protein [Oscillospiraceae bacterium]|nr:phosphate ABC transporter substrate-binding protein [Oscillospiraceae bacterium]
MKLSFRKIILTAIALSVITASACTEIGVTQTKTDSQGGLSGELTMTGSTSMADVSNALAEAFMKKHGNVTISVGGNGSGEGPAAVNDGTANIGLLSRGLKDSENPTGFDQYIIGYDGVAVIVHPQSPVKELSLSELADVFSGKITNWSELGGADAPIQCIGREAASGTRGAFEEIVGIKESAAYAEEQNSTGNVKQAVSNNPNAIGYVSLSSLDGSVTALSIDGVDATEENVASGSYKLQRPFLMITKKDSTDALTKAFLEFVFSEDGMKIIADDGVVPNKK